MIHMRKKGFAICLLAATMAFSTASAATGTVSASSLIMRLSPSSNSEAVTTLRQGKTVEILSQSGGWYKVVCGSYSGYVYASYVKVDGLKQGDQGDAVKEVQQRLKELGYYSNTCDGKYGSVTVKAVKAFQQKNGLTADGVADSATVKKLNASNAVKADGTKANATATSKPTATADTSTLKKGDKGAAVKALQQRLKELGYYQNTCDSNYGDRTVDAVKAFQKNNGLTADGVAGPSTQKKLNAANAIKADGTKANATATPKPTATPDTSTLKKGDKGTAVKALQQRLKELGYYQYTCDSTYGDRTVEAVKAFQKKNGLTQDGVAGPSTQKKLNAANAIKADGTKANATATPDTSTLKKGDKGTAVKELQQRLKELGYYTNTCDSTYGDRTEEAVKAFQTKNGLTADGIAGPSTQKKLNSTSAIPAKEDTKDDSTLQKGDSGYAVRKLQQRLKELGYYTNTCDGDYGYRTVEAVKAFQKKNGLTQDGIAGTTTLAKLNSNSAIPAKEAEKDDGTLKKGDQGDKVTALQKRLKELGYYTYTPDGQYGDRTVDAVKAFQKKNGLTQDGIAGPSTQTKLNSTSAIPAKDEETKDDGTLQKGDKGDAVKTLQKRLKELGYYTLSPDGEYGYRTVEAVKAFQKKNGLTADGVAGPTTQAKLNSSSAISANTTTSVTLNTNQTLKKGDSGEQVKALQLRLKELGYYNTTVDSSYGYQTSSAVSEFQRLHGLNVTGTADSTTLKKLTSSAALTKSDAIKADKENNTYVTERLDWFKEGYKTFPSKAIIKVKDVKTGLIFNAKVMYGSNHLDAEPLTAADTAILLKINGGVDFSWRRRAMLVQYNGHVYAASIYSEPHGDQTIYDNNFDGQFCLHFYGSKTHGTDVVDSAHQSCVAEAMKATW